MHSYCIVSNKLYVLCKLRWDNYINGQSPVVFYCIGQYLPEVQISRSISPKNIFRVMQPWPG